MAISEDGIASVLSMAIPTVGGVFIRPSLGRVRLHHVENENHGCRPARRDMSPLVTRNRSLSPTRVVVVCRTAKRARAGLPAVEHFIAVAAGVHVVCRPVGQVVQKTDQLAPITYVSKVGRNVVARTWTNESVHIGDISL